MTSPVQRAGDAAVDRAIEASRSFLLKRFIPTDSADRQLPPDCDSGLGYWLGELEADTTLESDYILFLYFLNPESNREKIRKLGNFIKSKQLPDGTWNIFPGGPGEISASVKAYFALKLAGVPVSDPLMVKAREAILAMGGADRVNSFTKIYLSFLNQFDWDDCPAIPPEIVLLPRFFYFNIYEISYWSRAMLVPLSILYARKPKRAVPPEAHIDEIFLQPRRRANGNGNGHAPEGNGNGAGRNGGNTFPLSAGEALHQPAIVNRGDHHGAARASEPAGLHAGEHENGRGDHEGEPQGGHNGNHGAGGNEGHHAVDHGGGGGSSSNGGSGGIGSNGDGRAMLDVLLGLKIPRDPNLFTWKNFFLLVDRILKLLEKAPLKPFRNLALRTAEKWMVARFDKSDGLGAIFPAMVNSAIAMMSLGYDEGHPHVASTLDKLRELEIEDGDAIRLQPCLSPIWDTALAINALCEADVGEAHPAIVAAARWLVSKEVRRSGDWQLRNPKLEASGWYFQFKNEFYPDVDDTAAVLMALERASLEEVEGGEGSLRRGIAWTLSMQCSNGGWAAFDVDVDREIFTKFPFADHNAMLDPACSDITGRVLEMIGRFQSLRDDTEVRTAIERGVDFLRRTQDPSGSWYGRWGVNYIYGTWQVLKGLATIEHDRGDPMIRRAVDWLRSCQNPDGGWGESCQSYEEPETKGRGTSTASQTAWAVMGLIAAGEEEGEAVRRGIQFLTERQNPDGTWTENEFTGTGFPRVFYLKYHLYSQYFPLFALAYYRNTVRGESSVKPRKNIQLPKTSREGLRRLSILRAMTDVRTDIQNDLRTDVRADVRAEVRGDPRTDVRIEVRAAGRSDPGTAAAASPVDPTAADGRDRLRDPAREVDPQPDPV